MIDFLGNPLETAARCHARRSPVLPQWLTKYEEAGLLAALADDEKAAARQAIVAAAFPLVVETGRTLCIDALSVARSGVRDALVGFFALPILGGQSWGVIEDLKSDGETYCLQIGDSDYRLWSTMETGRFADACLMPFTRMVRLMNALLRGQGIADRAYYYYSGPDSRLFVLSAQLHRRLIRAGHLEAFYGGCPQEQ